MSDNSERNNEAIISNRINIDQGISIIRYDAKAIHCKPPYDYTGISLKARKYKNSIK